MLTALSTLAFRMRAFGAVMCGDMRPTADGRPSVR
jgi:hypothetical protein